jgi:NADH dehydrogenase
VILIAGGTGTLGRETVRLLAGHHLRIRVLTRDPARAEDLRSECVEIMSGDVRNPASLGPALAGVDTVISAISGYGPGSGGDPGTVDGEGNRNLIRAADAAGVKDFVLVSVHGAAPDHPMELMRMKFLAELELKRRRLAWTIIRPTLFMETWVTVVGESLLKTGRTLVFGRGENPINFVSARDVACWVERAVMDTSLRGAEMDIGGPENLTLNQVAAACAAARGRSNRPRRIPRAAMRLMSVLAGPVHPGFARLAHDAVVMDTRDFTFDTSAIGRGDASIPQTSLRAMLEGEHVAPQ